MNMTFHIYLDEKKEYRWNLKHQNGKIIADSGEGYKKKADCENGIRLVKASWGCDTIDETEKKN